MPALVAGIHVFTRPALLLCGNIANREAFLDEEQVIVLARAILATFQEPRLVFD